MHSVVIVGEDHKYQNLMFLDSLEPWHLSIRVNPIGVIQRICRLKILQPNKNVDHSPQCGLLLLTKNARRNLAMNVGESELSTLIPVRQAGVINAEQMHNRGLHVVNVNGIRRNIPGIVIGCAVDISTFYSATC